MTTKELMQGIRTAPAMNYFGAPQVVFAPEDGTGTDNTGEDAARAAAEAAQKAAEEAAAAEAAAKEAGDAEAARLAEDAKKAADVLAKEKADLLKEVMDKKSKLKEKDDDLKAAQAELAKFKGIDPDKYAALVKAEADAERAKAEAAGDFDRVKQMMAEAHKTELAEKDAEIERLRAESAGAAKVIDGLTIGNDFAGSKYIAENLTLSPAKARVIYGSHFETKDGKTVAYDKPAGQANRTMLVDGSGEPLSFDAAFEKIVAADPDKNSILKAKVTSGSGGKTTEAETKKKEEGAQPYGRELIAQQFFKGDKR